MYKNEKSNKNNNANKWHWDWHWTARINGNKVGSAFAASEHEWHWDWHWTAYIQGQKVGSTYLNERTHIDYEDDEVISQSLQSKDSDNQDIQNERKEHIEVALMECKQTSNFLADKLSKLNSIADGRVYNIKENINKIVSEMRDYASTKDGLSYALKITEFSDALALIEDDTNYYNNRNARKNRTEIIENSACKIDKYIQQLNDEKYELEKNKGYASKISQSNK